MGRFEEFSEGLFGSPDGNRKNDWMDITAQPLAIPSDERGRGAFDYCHDNWCVSEDDSLMTYPEGTTYGDHKCADEEEQDLIFDPPVVAEPLCFSTGDKLATSDKVCPASPDGIVQIVHQSSDKLPAGGDQDIIYGIVLEE